jgi:cytochrome c oxidase subunit III
MEAASITPVAHDDHHHGPPEANQSSRVDKQTLGMLLFIVSELMLFGAFFTAYFFIRVVNDDPWPPGPEALPIPVAVVNTFVLLSSSLTMHFALHSARTNNRWGMKLGMVTTMLLGVTFLATQLNEYIHLGFSPQTNAQGSIFYGLTGLHGAHVLIGLIMLGTVTARVFKGHFSPESHLGLEVPGIYWHFVDGMWIIVFTTLYVL